MARHSVAPNVELVMPAVPKSKRRHGIRLTAPRADLPSLASDSLPSTAPETLRLGIICNRQLCAGCLRTLLEGGFPGAETHTANSFDRLRAALPSGQPIHAIIYSVISTCSLDVDELMTLCGKAAPVPVIVHLDMPDAEVVRRVLRAGARGVLPTSMPINLAVAVVQLVVAGETYVPPVAVSEIRRPGRHKRLTPRQTAVLRLIMDGKSNKEIGRDLGVGENTIKFHIAALMQKLEVSNRVRLAVVASKLLDRPLEVWPSGWT